MRHIGSFRVKTWYGSVKVDSNGAARGGVRQLCGMAAVSEGNMAQQCHGGNGNGAAGEKCI